MKLLLDQNLSFKLCTRLADVFPDSSQARLLGLDQADDRVLWTGQDVTSCTDAETAKTVDRLGRMLKHFYPKDKDWASPEDRKRW